MANYNLGSAGDISSINDFHKVQQYLYKMNENLRYMFNNLTPEDNYSEQARLTYVADGERQSSIEVALDHINLEMVEKGNVVSAINMSKEQIKILADKIALEGLVTVNSYFQIGLDGSITARNGKFSGDITASTITGSTFQLNRGAKIGFVADGVTFRLGDFIVNDWYGRQILESFDETTGMGGLSDDPDSLYLWAGYSNPTSYIFVVNGSDAYVQHAGTGRQWPIAETLARLSDSLEAEERDYDGEELERDDNNDGEDWDLTDFSYADDIHSSIGL